MQSLNSTSDTRRALIVTGVGMFIAFLFLVPLAAFAATYTVTITSPSTGSFVAANSTITISGTVTPAPTLSGTNVAVSILEPNGQTATAAIFPVATSTGAYSGSIVTGGPNFAVNGTYRINVNYEGAPALITVTYGSNSTAPPSGVGTTTTVIVSSVTTIVSSVVTTVSETPVTTTIVSQGAGVTTVVSSITTVVSSVTSTVSDSTALAIGAVGVIIAIIAAVLAVLAMRKK